MYEIFYGIHLASDSSMAFHPPANEKSVWVVFFFASEKAEVKVCY
jgi:hypothetical protein